LIFDNRRGARLRRPVRSLLADATPARPEARRSDDDSAPFRASPGQVDAPVVTTGGLRVLPHFGFADAPPIDLLVVPGLRHPGPDPRRGHPRLDSSRRRQRAQGTSVVHGLVALRPRRPARGPPATTHWARHDLLQSLSDRIKVERDLRVVDDGIITSAGVAAGMDMAFYVVETLFGRDVADETPTTSSFGGRRREDEGRRERSRA